MSLPVPYYDRDGITLYCADNADILPYLEPGSVDLVLTDPPYGDVTHKGARSVAASRALIDFASTTSAELRTVMTMMSPLCRAWFVATMEWRHIADLERVPPDGWRFIRFGIWTKPNGAPQFTGDRPGTGWEGIAFLHRDTGRLRWHGGGRLGVWNHAKTEGQHPTQKPISLVREWVRLFSDPGDLVLDPFMGSGTTGVACLSLGRRFIGIEIEERHCETAVKRLSQRPLFVPHEDLSSCGTTGKGIQNLQQRSLLQPTGAHDLEAPSDPR